MGKQLIVGFPGISYKSVIADKDQAAQEVVGDGKQHIKGINMEYPAFN